MDEHAQPFVPPWHYIISVNGEELISDYDTKAGAVATFEETLTKADLYEPRGLTEFSLSIAHRLGGYYIARRTIQGAPAPKGH